MTAVRVSPYQALNAIPDEASRLSFTASTTPHFGVLELKKPVVLHHQGHETLVSTGRIESDAFIADLRNGETISIPLRKFDGDLRLLEVILPQHDWNDSDFAE